jgi:AcrR family transcriptional regulator
VSAPQRDDSRRNRENVLRAAVESLSTGGSTGDLHTEIARRTGLGRSTVYRHVGDRRDVAESVVADQLGLLRGAVREVTEGRATIRDLLGLIMTTQASMHPLVELVMDMPPRAQERYVATIVRAVTPAFEQARASGQVRADSRPEDLPVFLAMLSAAGEYAQGPEDARRMVDLLLDGLCGPAPAEPGTPTAEPGSPRPE